MNRSKQNVYNSNTGYAGYLTKQLYNQNISFLGKLYHSNVPNKTLIRKYIERGFDLIKNPIKNNIYVYVFIVNKPDFQLYFDGATGFSPWENVIYLYVDRNSFDDEIFGLALMHTILHEYFHTLIKHYLPGKTLLDSLLTEGYCDYASLRLLNEVYTPPYLMSITDEVDIVYQHEIYLKKDFTDSYLYNFYFTNHSVKYVGYRIALALFMQTSDISKPSSIPVQIQLAVDYYLDNKGIVVTLS